MIKYLDILTDSYIAKNVPVTLTIDNDEVVTFDVQWDSALHQIGTKPIGDDIIDLNRAVVTHISHSLFVLSLRHPFPVFDAQTNVVENMTTTQILNLALSNLYDVSCSLDRIQSILPNLVGFSYWYELYRIATCSLTNQSTELEIHCVRILQSLVLVKTVTDSDDDEVIDTLTKNLQSKVHLLLEWR